MKISALNYANSVQNNSKTIEQKKEKIAQQQNQTTMPKHSMSEVLGRSQVVSFNGTNKVRSTKFIHDCSDSSGKEQIIYDRETGIFTHATYSHSGKLVRKEEFDPQNQTQYLTSIESDGTRVEKTITLNDEKTVVKDSQARITNYFTRNILTGDSHEEITEYEFNQ